MDPQSQTFTPYSKTSNDSWRVQSEVSRLQQIQTEHAERIARLERRQDEDARVKSVWGSGSPFPSVLSGTPQQAPLSHPSADHFRTFDDDANNLMSSLHLDAEEEPRRAMGSTSRANSVRFDESANQNHFTHLSRPSFDYPSRSSSSSLGGLALGERSASHKSDGRASSAHSIRSATSGRASSLNLDTSYAADSSRSSQDTPGLAPGLALLGSVPAIIRCWMNTNFKHDALLYAAVCTGSYKSYLALALIQKLGFEELIAIDELGTKTIELPVYFPEAVPHPASSRSGSPAPQLPSLTVNFQVANTESSADSESRAIQVVLGSDTLRTHSADILFSSSNLTLFDDERNKLSIPMVRPENAATFNTLRTLDVPLSSDSTEELYLNGNSQDDDDNAAAATLVDTANGIASASAPATAAAPATASAAKYRPPIGLAAASLDSYDTARSSVQVSDQDQRPASGGSATSRSRLSTTARESNDADHSAFGATHRTASGSPAVWSNWRKEGNAPTSANPHTPTHASSLDWAAASKGREASYQRKDTGIKVLKPKSASRAFSGSVIAPAGSAISPSIDGARSSRFFDEGRSKSNTEAADIGAEAEQQKKENTSQSSAAAAAAAAAESVQPKVRSNPIGGGSAFSWLNSNGTK